MKKKPPKWNPEHNHGRYGAADYVGCPKVKIPCEGLQAGAACPECQTGGFKGKLYEIDAGIVIRLQGNPLISGTQYCIEKLRCNLCGKQYSGEIPPAIAREEKYSVTCRSSIAMGRYYMGLPFKRMEYWQRLQGIPLPDATQYEQMRLLKDCIKPVYDCLLQLAPEGQTLFYDDTTNRILQLTAATAPTRKGVYTTAIVSHVGHYVIHLFCTSQRIARDNITRLLSQRDNPADFCTMSDASNNNVPPGSDIPENLLARWILCFCLVHGRRKFWEIQEQFPPECDFVLEQISQVYQNERICWQQRLSAEERLIYHQTHSAPLLQALHIWLTNKLQFYAVELNSNLGQAIKYMLRHWEALTRFLYVKGAPLDNSLCERAIKVVIRHRKNSLFFKTPSGAEVGDCLMSVMHTAARNHINVWDYLNTLQRYPVAVAQEPELWLPWNYHRGLAQAA